METKLFWCAGGWSIWFLFHDIMINILLIIDIKIHFIQFHSLSAILTYGTSKLSKHQTNYVRRRQTKNKMQNKKFK